MTQPKAGDSAQRPKEVAELTRTPLDRVAALAGGWNKKLTTVALLGGNSLIGSPCSQ